LELEGGERIKLPVEYKWMPPLCLNCESFGHVEGQCPMTKVWRPKVQKAKNVDQRSAGQKRL